MAYNGFRWLETGSSPNIRIKTMNEHINAVTNHTYALANQTRLQTHAEGYDLTSVEWAGFKQWQEVGRKVKKGAKGCRIIMVVEKWNKEKTEKTEVCKSTYVFNKDHTEEC